MKLKDITKEELELMGYDDIAYLILQEEKKKMKINDLFKKVCDILNLSNQVFENQIADFFAILTTDKRFIMLEDGFWDLKEKHSEKVIIDEDDEDIFVEEVDEELENEEEEEFFDEDEEDSRDEDLKDLVVIDEEEDEQ